VRQMTMRTSLFALCIALCIAPPSLLRRRFLKVRGVPRTYAQEY